MAEKSHFERWCDIIAKTPKMNTRTPGPDYEYRYNELKKWTIDYLSEMDNPVPDYNYRRTIRNHIRVLVGAPSEPRQKS